MSRYLFAASALFLVHCAFAQNSDEGFTCGANEQPALLDRIAADPLFLQQALEANDQLDVYTQQFERSGARNNYVIPVVFHIIHYNGSENISDAQIIDAVRVLNEDFNDLNPATATVNPEFAGIVANVGIQFELARRDPAGNCTNGITRTVSFLTHSGNFEMTQLIQWPRNNYLNIWVSASANGAAGYTYYPMWLNNWPEADGIVIQHSYTGSIGTSTPSRSHVLTHEVGHWLNLMHCWGNSNEPGLQSNCTMDDGVSDTPLTKGWVTCALNGSSCDDELDNVENYMEYSYCYKMFTNGQAERMLAALNSSIAQRNQLWQPATLVATGLTEEPVLCEVHFMHGRPEICVGGSVQFTDLSYHSVVERTWTFPGGTPSTSNEIAPLVTYDVPGVHPVILEVSDGTTTLSRTETGLVRVYADPGMPVPFQEGFEGMQSLADGDWWAKDHNGDNTFMISNEVSFSGERSVMIHNGPGYTGRVDELRSPSLDLENASGLAISFRYAFAQRHAYNDDRLRVHISFDCGVNWSIRRQLRGSTDLPTAGIVVGDFAPQSADDWAITVIDVPLPIFYVSNLLMRFEFTSDGGNHLYIDDINIHGTPVGIDDHGTTGAIAMLLSPNPSTTNTNLIFNSLERSPIRIVLRDMLGRELINVLDGKVAAGPQRIAIPLENLSSGIYLVDVILGGTRNTLKVIKE